MLFTALQRTDDDKVFSIFRNVAGASITVNYPVVWDITSPDGNRVSQPATATLSLFVGVADETAADSSYFRVQRLGYRASVFVTNDTSVAIAAGDILIPVTAVWHCARSGASDGKSGFLYAGEAFATATAGAVAAANKKCLIRAL